ncbi:hypothetical protein BGZ93_001369 [Podila epicladia]|nr:hypothetical protein BGZ92_002570 [Podila epicladia]KAG0084139.1 hypothetical protein BGZ93_001369 [Podila epicladia]
MQKRWMDQNGRTHWDIVTTRVDSALSWNYINNTLLLTLEAFHLDVGAEYYNSTLDEYKATLAVQDDNIAILQFMGRETFEATYLVPNRAVSLYNHSWVDWGFSKDDVRNLTTFLLGGTMLNSGTLMMQIPVLLANVSDLTVGFLFGASLIMVGLGWFLSRGVDSVVCDPITEVLPKVLDYKRPNNRKEEAVPSLRYRRVANLTLVSSHISKKFSLAPDRSPLQDVDTENDRKWTAAAHKTKTLLLRMEVDSDDDEINAVELFETMTKGHLQESSNVQGQTDCSVALLSETCQPFIPASTFP